VRNVKVTFVVGFAILALAFGVTLTGSPPRVLGEVAPQSGLLHITSEEPAVCQAGEVLPAGVSAVRFSLWAFFGSRMHVVAYSGSQVLTEGSRNGAWTGDTVTVPVKPVARTTSDVTLCFALTPNSEPVYILGGVAPKGQAAVMYSHPTLASQPPGKGGQSLGGKVNVAYLAPGTSSWWSSLVSVARHTGLGRAFSGTWIVFLIIALMAGVGVLAVRLTLKEIS
jgi:hypothetical protein